MKNKVSIIALGVSDLARAKAFYTALGLPIAAEPGPEIVFFDMGAQLLSLYPEQKLLEDVWGEDAPAKQNGTPRFTLARNEPDEASVDATLKEAETAGATIVKPAQKVFWGGYSGYFQDPDGHLWEVAHNPFMDLS